MTTVLIIVNVFASIAIIALTLMQQSKGDMGSAFGGGSSQSMFGSRGSANFLSRMTSFMLVVFFASSLSLAYIYSNLQGPESVVTADVVEETTLPLDNSVPNLPESVVPEVDSAENPDDGAVPALPEEAQRAEDTEEN